MIESFSFARQPKIIFGVEKFTGVAGMMPEGCNAVVVTGGGSLENSGRLDALADVLKKRNVEWTQVKVSGEPSPEVVDNAVAECSERNPGVVLAVGGGSVIDAGKAISAMLRHKGSVKEYLEGVGDPSKLTGDKVPFIAVPTTSGTGSEATKNAVISSVGENGFKKSLRHDNFVPDVAVLDPELTLSCPAEVTASCGMDAFSQLLESYVSTNASPMTDSLALKAMEYIRDCLVPACTDGANDIDVRAGMAYASLISGITLANAGLCTVHGIAGVLGGFTEIPHGVACGTLLGACMEATVKKLKKECSPDHPSLIKFAIAGNVLCNTNEKDVLIACDMLVDKLKELTDVLDIPRLGMFGITEQTIQKLIDKFGNKNNPVPLSREEMIVVIRHRM